MEESLKRAEALGEALSNYARNSGLKTVMMTSENIEKILGQRRSEKPVERYNSLASANLGDQDLQRRAAEVYKDKEEKFREGVRGAEVYSTNSIVRAIIDNKDDALPNSREIEKTRDNYENIDAAIRELSSDDMVTYLNGRVNLTNGEISVVFDRIISKCFVKAKENIDKLSLLCNTLIASKLSNEVLEQIRSSMTSKDWSDLAKAANRFELDGKVNKGSLFKDIIANENKQLTQIPNSLKEVVHFLRLATTHNNEGAVKYCLAKFANLMTGNQSLPEDKEKYSRKVLFSSDQAILRGNLEIAKAYLAPEIWQHYSNAGRARIIAAIGLRLEDGPRDQLMNYLFDNSLLTRRLAIHIAIICEFIGDQAKLNDFYAQITEKLNQKDAKIEVIKTSTKSEKEILDWKPRSKEGKYLKVAELALFYRKGDLDIEKNLGRYLDLLDIDPERARYFADYSDILDVIDEFDAVIHNASDLKKADKSKKSAKAGKSKKATEVEEPSVKERPAAKDVKKAAELPDPVQLNTNKADDLEGFESAGRKGKPKGSFVAMVGPRRASSPANERPPVVSYVDLVTEQKKPLVVSAAVQEPIAPVTAAVPISPVPITRERQSQLTIAAPSAQVTAAVERPAIVTASVQEPPVQVKPAKDLTGEAVEGINFGSFADEEKPNLPAREAGLILPKTMKEPALDIGFGSFGDAKPKSPPKSFIDRVAPCIKFYNGKEECYYLYDVIGRKLIKENKDKEKPGELVPLSNYTYDYDKNRLYVRNTTDESIYLCKNLGVMNEQNNAQTQAVARTR